MIEKFVNGIRVFVNTVNGVPDYSVFTEPTRTLLMESSSPFIAVETVSDTFPNWQGFLDSNDTIVRGGNGVFDALLATDYAVAMDAYQLILRLKDGAGGALEIRTLQMLLNLLTPSLTSTQLQQLKDSVASNFIPVGIVQ